MCVRVCVGVIKRTFFLCFLLLRFFSASSSDEESLEESPEESCAFLRFCFERFLLRSSSFFDVLLVDGVRLASIRSGSAAIRSTI